VETFFGEYFYFPYRETEREKLIDEKFSELRELLDKLKTLNCKIVVNEFVIPVYSSRGVIENKQKSGYKENIHNLNKKLIDLSTDDPSLFIFDTNSLYSKYGHNIMCDKKMRYMGDLLAVETIA